MWIRLLLLAMTLMILCSKPSSCFVQWLFGSDKSKKFEQDSDYRVPMPTTDPQFEMAVTDEKFVEKHSLALNLSPLDTCQHLVIADIKTSCTSMTEEELAKLSVQLLNCQFQTENRPTFPCFKDMTIAECTQEMDGTTWNAYQIVANRARAICYSTRQQQFRMKTENTVNRLVHTAQGQIAVMNAVREGQEKVHEVTSDTLRKMEKGQEDLLSHQAVLKSAQTDIHDSITSTLHDLIKEKSLIAAGNKEIADVTDNLRKKLDNATKKLEEQEMTQKDNHKNILNDLAAIRERARQVWDKIDEATASVSQYHEDTAKHYTSTIENVARVNATISSVLSSLADLENSISERLGWITTYLDGTGERFCLLCTVVLHVLYFLEAAVTMSILRTPHFSRVVLLLVVPLNAWSEINHATSLNFTAMTIFLILTLSVNYVAGWTYDRYHAHRLQCRQITNQKPMELEASDNNSAHVVPYSPSPNLPDIQKLVSLLESLNKKGLLSPSEPTNHESTEDAEDTGDESYLSERNTSVLGSSYYPKATTGPLNTSAFLNADSGTASGISDSTKARVEMVRRRLLNSPAPEMSPGGRGGLYTSPLTRRSLQGSPAPSNRSSRESTPNRRAPCYGVTVAGSSCKNSATPDSNYCRRHQLQDPDTPR